MSTKSETVNRLLDQYDHRPTETVNQDLDAQGVLEGYLEQQGVSTYNHIDSDHPYQVLLGRNAPCSAEVAFTAHYTYQNNGEIVPGSTGVRVAAESMEEAIEQVLPEDRVIDVAGADINETKEVLSPSGEKIEPESVHCVVFYDEPVPTENMIDRTRFEGGFMHKKTVEDALSEESIGTAIVTTGQTPEGEHRAGMQVDYWTRFIDGVEEDGIDYTQIDWNNPSGI